MASERTSVKQQLEIEVGDLLRGANLTLAVAESCTGGLVSHRITNVPGSSDYFDRAVVSYSNRSKLELLGVKEASLMTHGAVSERVATEMAEGIRSLSEVDVGLSTTGIAGPGGGTEEKPVGLVYVGLVGPESSGVRKFLFGGDRLENKRKAAANALRYLEDLLSGAD